MTEQELRTLTAAIILSGQYAEGNSGRRHIMVKEAIKTTNVLLEVLKDPASLGKHPVQSQSTPSTDFLF